MSDARAIEAVTETLRALVEDGIKSVEPGATAVARPPHRVSPTGQPGLVNLFLYRTSTAPERRNDPPPGLLPGETGEPPLPLVLHYLLTPFVQGDDDLVAHRLLGAALQALHTRPLLSRAELAQTAAFSDLSRQPDHIRITWHAVDEKEIYSLWSVFQTPYRLTAAFEVRAVLIDSRRPVRTPLPVLARGADGRGPRAGADPRPTTPAVHRLHYPGGRPAARTGDTVELHGTHLSGVTGIRLTRLAATTAGPTGPAPDAVDVPVAAPAPGDPVLLRLPGGLAAGVHALTLLGGSPRTELPVGPWYLALAPAITSTMPAAVTRDGAGTARITLTADPPFAPGQRVDLLLGADAHTARELAGNTARFTVRHARPGSHPVRLRVDGVDSLLVPDRTTDRPSYDPTQRLTVT
ncbi:DUF4255 domain-containing protein [Streptomyces sp. NPDC089799]|uniref:DUF4255 domain-containing protein n=1 Tax=Streptomyces sp. NPDC089799 TaxID=3155066 RepID=UPI00343FD128